MNTINKLDTLILECVDNKNFLDLNDQTDLIDDMFYDSISIIQLVVNIENEFGVIFSDEYLSLDYLRSYRWLKEYVEKIISNGNLNV